MASAMAGVSSAQIQVFSHSRVLPEHTCPLGSPAWWRQAAFRARQGPTTLTREAQAVPRAQRAR